MDRFDAMRLLVRVVERRSFTAAATDLGLPRSTVTQAIQRMEARLGVRLLERTTRRVVPTLDGEAYYRRCLEIVADVDEVESAFAGGRLSGLLRVDVHPLLARTFLLPHLPGFLAEHPSLELRIGAGDRLVDLIGEGVDVAIRAGERDEAGMVARRVADLREVTCASPGYLSRHGVPATPDDLEGHEMVGFVSSRTSEVMPLEFLVGNEVRRVTLPGRVTVGASDVMAELARLGFGLVQQPRYRFEDDLRSGALVEVLPAFPPPPTPLSVVYPQTRRLSPRVRAFVDWTVRVFASAET